MPKVSEQHRESRRDQILDAALRCFIERGFQGTSMSDVLKESGLSAGAVYSYFPSKQELVFATARRAIAQQLAHILAAADGDAVPSPARLVRAIGDRFDQAGVPLSIVVQLWGEAATDDGFLSIASDAMRGFQGGFRTLLSRWHRQERGSDAATAEAWAAEVTPVMVSVVQGYMIQSTIAPGFDRERYFAGVDRVLG